MSISNSKSVANQIVPAVQRLMKKVESAKWRLWRDRTQGAIKRLREVLLKSE
ncbi:hypothetical protein HNR39_003971 [Glaciimonas immobilis]|uniref:Uncharacterized protein n=1 Tax=Glaciimonas immobilis TaxID=728004 RepID=A0A840RYB6_9BURK|nr:hypothetical protein [Glaciimonas immobilis]